MKARHLFLPAVLVGLAVSATIPTKQRGFFGDLLQGVENIGNEIGDAFDQLSDTVEDSVHIVTDAAGNIISEYEDISGAVVYGCTVVSCLDVLGTAGIDCAIAVLKKVDLIADFVYIKSIS
ncbi:hypothetical protein UCRPA7_8428 [Phaeoacremonium minimum UCRPA7]|uniref:Uncharacterized protein n=1 Tax=Phaeoacremonium minimum (strain UCR-PA7) TaxID=1286976 RepID=R8B9X0_PHAM7|nr:hypothetical protein UCRPA7_8428 [Phaeoacremonium minimum UCRPA7]EON96076.1 hypothetical protein UCRPA7_8428 [Phaeoacremonium minimum UCRPA7]